MVFDDTITGGQVTPQGPACFNPFEGCAMDVTGVAVGTLSGAVSLAAEWDFQAVMALAPVSATEWSNLGIYSFMRRFQTPTDEPADLLGIFTGNFDIETFTATIDYEEVPGNGLLGGMLALTLAAGTGAQTLPADAGHRDAAWLALQMWRHGPRLYGVDFELGLQRRERWLDLLERTSPARPAGHWEPGPWGC